MDGGLGALVRPCHLVFVLLPLLMLTACSRTHYRLRADRDSYWILSEKGAGSPWQIPFGFRVRPDPRSRFHDPTPPDDPILPPPNPQLYGYHLPDLPERDPRRFRRSGGRSSPNTPWEEIPTPEDGGYGFVPGLPISSLGQTESERDPKARNQGRFGPTSPGTDTPDGGPSVPQKFEWGASAWAGYGEAGADPGVRPASVEFSLDEIAAMPMPTAQENGTDGAAAQEEATPRNGSGPRETGVELRVAPLSGSAWEALPDDTLRRMFEFESVKEEFDRSFQRMPDPEQLDDSQRITLEDILDLASLNHRDYQTQKELLYAAALRLTLQRFDYEMKFTPSGNGTAVDYLHSRNAGITQNNLAISTQAAGEKILATGGNLLTRFANDVVLTFNGPDGFAADVGSELLLGVSQSVLQRDIVFENLTQAERDVVYAARDFARFRKVLFRNLATQYYNLLLAYRRIEIDSQDYFSTYRAFHQGEAEYRAGRLPRFQVDQLEQNALSSRSSLIGSSTSFEGALDNLKFAIGLPPELALNLDLSELEELTLRDESAVSGERVRRARRNLLSEREQESPDQGVLLNSSIDLTRRLMDWRRLRQQLGQDNIDERALNDLLQQLLVDEAWLLVNFNRDALQRALDEVPPAPPIRVFQRITELVQALGTLGSRQLDQPNARELPAPTRQRSLQDLQQLDIRLGALQVELEQAVASRRLDRVVELVTAAQQLLSQAEGVNDQVNEALGIDPMGPEESLRRTLLEVDLLLQISQDTLTQEVSSLAPLEINMDDAMLSALLERFDVMNERGALADSWRRIKLTGDDLRSVLNLNATQVVRTRSDVNRPFDFTFDDSQTRLALQFDTPLNRRAQRNAFRAALLDYQRGLRNLMALEDGIKLDIREELRQLQLNREQYRIAVASAALAFERVVSTRLQLQLGVQNVAARDFLEAQQAYTASLSNVAGVQIRYILNRIQLFLDLEQLEVDEQGFWNELYDETFQPTPRDALPSYARPAYGELPPRVWYSRAMRRMIQSGQ
jgi:outer membrane protein TolC